jgi:hypothetical protein
MDVRDMSFFGDESFDCVLDKGKLYASHFMTSNNIKPKLIHSLVLLKSFLLTSYNSIHLFFLLDLWASLLNLSI